MGTIYSKKRLKSGLTKSEVAKELGINYIKYDMIEKGRVKMPSNLIDKFNSIMGITKGERTLKTLENEKIVNQWYDEVCKEENGVLSIKKLMDDFNIPMYKTLGQLLGYSDGTLLSTNLKHPEKATYDFKNKLYNFFQDELNIQPKGLHTFRGCAKENKKVVNKNQTLVELEEWWNNFSVSEFRKKHNMGITDFAKACGMSKDSVYHYERNDVTLPRGNNLLKIKKFVENYVPKVSEPTQIATELKLPDLPNEDNNFYQSQKELYDGICNLGVETENPVIKHLEEMLERERIEINKYEILLKQCDKMMTEYKNQLEYSETKIKLYIDCIEKLRSE